MNIWQLQEAKNRLSHVISRALKNGPQIITRRGKKTVVLLSMQDYEELTKPKTNLREFFRASPLVNEKLDLARPIDYGRDVDEL